MDPVLITRQMLSERWCVSTQAIINYEQEGIITRNPHIPTPRYSLEEIMKIEGCELSPMSPLERRKLESRIRELEEVIRLQQEKLTKMIILGNESMVLMQHLDK